jgi:hypothetical protein
MNEIGLVKARGKHPAPEINRYEGDDDIDCERCGKHLLYFLKQQEARIEREYIKRPDYEEALEGFTKMLVYGARVCELGESQGRSIAIQLLKRLGITRAEKGG